VLSKLSQDGKLKALVIDRKLFHVDGAFAVGSAVVCVLVATIYGMWW
jgi:SSS family solute:Na+ symporter